MTDCIFCQLQKNKEAVIAENNSFYLVRDKYPITKGHSLIISKRHFETIFDMNSKEASDLPDIISKAKKNIDELFHPVAYNLGNNNGKEAGQVIFHSHIHVIPRYGLVVDHPDLHHTGVYNKVSGKIQSHEQVLDEKSVQEREKYLKKNHLK